VASLAANGIFLIQSDRESLTDNNFSSPHNLITEEIVLVHMTVRVMVPFVEIEALTRARAALLLNAISKNS